MSATAAFVAHEVRTQLRSLRFRVVAVLYAVAGSVPAALIWSRRGDLKLTIGGATFAAEAFCVLPALTAVVALLLSLDAVTREQDEGAWTTVSLAGMSSAGYLVRRWLGLQAVLVPLTALPVIVTAVAAAAVLGPAALTALPFAEPWLLHLVPLAAAASALGLALGTIAGGTLNAFLFSALVLWLVPGLANSALARWGVVLPSPFDWLSTKSFRLAVPRLLSGFGASSAIPWFSRLFPLEMSEAPWDPAVAAEQYLALAAAPAALAAAALGLAVRHLRRTRPDVRPLRVRPDHPLRNFLRVVARLRERYTPDPRPSGADLAVLALALLAAAGLAGWMIGRSRDYRRQGEDRFYAEEAAGPAAMAADVVPGRWRIAGTVGPGRGVAVAVTAELRNQGREPRGHLAFSLSPRLRIEDAAADAGTLRLSRRWDRLAVDVTPPIPPGGRRELRLRLRGEPGDAVLPLGDGVEYWGFHKIFGNLVRASFSRDVPPLGLAYRLPAVSPRRIDLAAADLTPVPRYETWRLKRGEESSGAVYVADETYLPAADLSLDLAVPAGAFLADSCGDTTGVGAGRGRLAGSCRLAVGELAVAGGPQRPLPRSAEGATVAVLPFHRGQGDLHLGFLARGERRLDDAWPGLAGLGRTVVLEWPADEGFALDASRVAIRRRWMEGRTTPRVQGELVRIPEFDLIDFKPLDPDALLAGLVSDRLARRRALAPEDALLFRHLFTELVRSRLGLRLDGGATVSGIRPGMESLIRVPPPTDYYSSNYWNARFPALVAVLRYRMGPGPLFAAVEEMLGSPDRRPATRADFYAALERHSEVPIHRLIEDYFVKGDLPETVLDGVSFDRAGDGWRVAGRMVNRGTGEALCKVVLTTDLGRQEAMVGAEGGKAGAFAFTTAHRPQAVLLDPDRECHRLVPTTAPNDRVFYKGTGGTGR